VKILLFHPARLPPKDYGGVERVVLWLSEGLRDFGHQVTIAALEGSSLPRGVDFLPISPADRSAGSLALKTPAGTEIVHFQAPPEADYFRKGVPPAVTTIHGNGKPGEVFPAQTVFLCRDHAVRHGRETFVYNGINPDEFALCGSLGTSKQKNRPLFLSKTTLRTKNLRGAMRIAREAGMRLTIAGGNRPLGLRTRAFFSRFPWLGPVAGAEKARSLAEASALLFPVIWDEPFGLVMVEAMLSGTPVVGSSRGSIPEVIGVSGGIVVDLPKNGEDAEGFARWRDALHSAQKTDPEALRNQAIDRFSHHRMAESYLEVYKRVIRGETL